MAKSSFFNIGKSILNELKDKIFEQSKETINSAKEEIIQKSTQTLIDTANKKVNELSKGKVALNLFTDTKEEEEKSREKINPVVDPNTITHIESEKGEDIDKVVVLPDERNPLQFTIDRADEKYRDGDGFEKNLHQNLEYLATNAITNQAEALIVLKELSAMAVEVEKFSEVQKTKRKEIEAQRDAYITKISAQKEVMLAYLDKTFDERRINFEKLFQVVDSALANNNMQQLALSLDSINNLATSSPFKDLASIEGTKNALEDKNHIWDI